MLYQHRVVGGGRASLSSFVMEEGRCVYCEQHCCSRGPMRYQAASGPRRQQESNMSLSYIVLLLACKSIQGHP